MTYALPPVWFWVFAVPLLALLVFANLHERKSRIEEDAIWRRLQQKLDGLNRPIFRPSPVTQPAGHVLYASSSTATINLAGRPEDFLCAPGAVIHVSDPASIQWFNR